MKQIHKDHFILVVDALSSTSFAKIWENLSVTGLMADDVNADEPCFVGILNRKI